MGVLILLIPLFIFLSLSEGLTPARQPNAVEAWIELPFTILGACGALSIGYGIANVIAQVQATFTEALDHAVSVADSQFATQDEVDTAWKALMNEIHKLGFVKGDISSLITLVEAAEDIDLSLYVEKGQAEFTAALQAAQAVVADKDNAVEQEI